MYFIGRATLSFVNNFYRMLDHHGFFTQFFLVIFSLLTMFITSTKEFTLVNNAIPSYDIAFQPTTPPLHDASTRPPSRPNGVTTPGGRPPRPHLTYLTSDLFNHLISPFQLGGAQDRCSATLLPIRSHPPAPHGPSTLIFPPLHPPLFHS